MDTDPLPTPSLAVNLLILLTKAMELHAPGNWGGWIAIVIIAIICLCLSAFVSGSEIAYFGLSRSDVEDLEEESEDSPAAARVVKLVQNSERLLATILIANNLVNITMVVLLAFAINQTINFNSEVVAFLLQTVFLTFLLLLFGEIFPKLVARGRMVKWVLVASSPLMAMYKIFAPLSKIMARSTSLVNRVVVKKSESISTDQLEKALEISDVKEGEDKEMLEGILSFGDKEVSDIMIPRVDVTGIEYHDTWTNVVDTIVTSGYSRIPVYDTTQDIIRGILYSKDLLPHIGKEGDTFKWQDLIRDAYFVPESRPIDDMLEDFRKRKIHIAIVIDEYGGTQGIVTLEDIIEEIVGEIDDEYDESTSMYKKISDDTYVFDAKIPIVDFCRITGVEEDELGDYGEAETLAGLLLAIKGDFPTRKESIVTDRFRFLVLDIEKHRITSVRVMVIDKN